MPKGKQQALEVDDDDDGDTLGKLMHPFLSLSPCTVSQHFALWKINTEWINISSGATRGDNAATLAVFFLTRRSLCFIVRYL